MTPLNPWSAPAVDLPTAGLHTIGLLTLIALVISASVWDVRERRIPNRLVALGGISAVTQQALLPWGQHPASVLHPGTPGLLQGALAALLMLTATVALWRLGLWGAGDAKWLTVLAAHATPGLVVPLLLLTALCGGVLALIWWGSRLPSPMPYALAIAAGQFTLMTSLSRAPATG